MKLYKALKLRKGLVSEITKLKQQINDRNSYLLGSVNGKRFNVDEKYKELLAKIEELVALKYIINEANREIQGKIYLLSEYKALISFWNGVSVVEGTVIEPYQSTTQQYISQYDEAKRDDLVKSFQVIVNALQDELDEYNFNTEIPWGEMSEEELEILDASVTPLKDN